MKRTNYAVTVTRAGEVVRNEVKFAFNSGIRASEAIVRDIARIRGLLYEGGQPERIGDRYDPTMYRRTWTGGTDVLLATVTKETP